MSEEWVPLLSLPLTRNKKGTAALRLFPGCRRYCGEYEGLAQPGAGYAYGKRLPDRESTKNACCSNPAASAQRFPTTPTRH